MAKAKKFSAFSGVFTPSILTILGVIMYLRLPWIVGQAGLLATLGIIVVAHIISASTGLSVASIATDKRVETGGTYFIISRSLGLPIGGTLGYALFVGLSFSVSLYLIGFAETFLGYFGFEVNLFTIRIAGSIILLLVTILTFISTSLAIKTQFLILTAMILSLLAIFLGIHEFTPAQPQWEKIPEALPWITLFAIFFPAVTGFEAGVSMSGDLKDPRRDIPLGTISAILVGLAVYAGLAFFFSYTVNNDILVNDPNVLFKIALVPQLVIIGILGATLSSALGSILGAPRIMQAISGDRIAPSFFSKGYGPSNEPRNALILTYIIAQAGILIGELNAIARIVTIFFIITYGFLNITYTVESWASSDFRPSFKIPRFVSIVGSLACIIIMIQLDVLALTGSTIILLALFFYLKNKELTLQTGDTRSSIWLSLVKTGLLKLTKSQTNTRNWRPNVILFSGSSGSRTHLIETAKALVGKLGIFTNFELVEHPDENLLFHRTARVTTETIGEHKDIITRKHTCKNIYEGMEMISKIYGFSGFEPNTILMGWAKNTRYPDRFEELIINLKKLDYNLTFLNYNKEKGFGNYKKIDFWWQGRGRNMPLAIHFIRFITASTEWRNANVRILAISGESKNIDKYYAILNQVIENYRIKAEIKVINNVEKLPEKDIIRSESTNTDLIINEIPEFNTKSLKKIITNLNEITEHLNSTLLISASSVFEEINALPEPLQSVKDKSDYQKPDISILNKLQLSGNEYVANEVLNLSSLLETHTEQFLNDTLIQIYENRNVFNRHFFNLIDKALEKLSLAKKIGVNQDKQREYLKILNDYTFHTQKQIKDFRDNFIKYEKESLNKGIEQYLTALEKVLSNTPGTIRLTFNRNDFRRLKTTGPLTWLNRAWKLAVINFTGKNLNYQINVKESSRFFIYHKRLKYLKELTEYYSSNSLSSFADLKKILMDVHDLIELILSGKDSSDGMITAKENINSLIQALELKDRDYIYSECNKLTNELIQDIKNYSETIQSPVAPLMNRRFKSELKKDSQMELMISDFPDYYHRITNNYINKSYLDFMYLTLKNRLKTKIEKTHADIEILIEGNILNKLKHFKNQLAKYVENRNNINPGKGFYEQKNISLPDLNNHLNTLFNEIEDAVNELPEKLNLTNGDLHEPLNLEMMAEEGGFEVSVRKTANFYISNELNDKLKKKWKNYENELSVAVNKIKDIIRLANFHLNKSIEETSETPDSVIINEQQDTLIKNLITNVDKEEYKLKSLIIEIKKDFENGLKNAFLPLSSAFIIKETDRKEQIKEAEKQKLFYRVQSYRQLVIDYISKQFVRVLYSSSEGKLWAWRMEQSRDKGFPYEKESFHTIIERISPSKSIPEALPFYYYNLFSGSSNIVDDFWIGMKQELEMGDTAIKRFIKGATGLLLITGERSSGKSSLSKHLANRHFARENIYNLKAPQESMADAELFEQFLLKNLNGQNNLQYTMNALPSKSVIIIHDLELWWERKHFGTQVIDMIISMVKEFGNKVLFIINVNQYALKIINKLCPLSTWALEIITCQPFDARELKDLIMIRHQAGGMKFVLNNKHEENMTGWDYARLFNNIFNLSSGNPGYAMNLWLAGIRKISGNTITMNKPYAGEISFRDQLTQHEIIYILQFILHRRFSLKNLAVILHNDVDNTEKVIRTLWQKGIILEKFPEVFALNPALEFHLVKKLKSLEVI